MKKNLLKTTALGLTLAMALMSAAGCGSSKDGGSKSSGDDNATTKNSSSDNAGSGSDESSDNSDDNDTANVDFKDCPWIIAHELSDAEYLELPEGATLYGDALPFTTDTLNNIPFHASGNIPLADCLNNDAYAASFFTDGLDYPNLEIDADDGTVGEALDNMKWYLSDTYLSNTIFRMSDDDFAALEKDHSDICEEYLLLDMLAAEFGSPNYVTYFSETLDAHALVNDLIHPESTDNGFSLELVYIGWQFEDFGIAAFFYDTSNVDSSSPSGIRSETSDHVGLVYVPIENGTLAEHNYDEESSYELGKNIVKDVIAEKQKVFGDVEFIKPDPSLLQ